jgi:hypothetical protein
MPMIAPGPERHGAILCVLPRKSDRKLWTDVWRLYVIAVLQAEGRAGRILGEKANVVTLGKAQQGRLRSKEGKMRRYISLALLVLAGLAPSTAGPVRAVGTEVRIFPSVKYVAQSSPGFSVDIRAENVSTPEMHVLYDGTNVDTELALGADPIVKASYAETNVDADLAVGDSAAREARGQGFQVADAGPVNRVLLWVKKVGAPEDGLMVEVQGDSGGLPDGVVMGASTIVAGADIGTSYAWVAFSLPTAPILSPGTQCHLVLRRTSPLGPDPANYYVWGADTSSPAYADGAASVYNGSTWAVTAPAADHAFKVDTAPTARAQGFRVPMDSPVNRVLLWLKRVGVMTEDDGSLVVEIRADSGGVPGDVVATSAPRKLYQCNEEVPPQCNDLLGTSYDWLPFNLIPPPQLSAGTQYHLVLEWTGVPDAPNSVVWGADTSSPGYGDGAATAGYGGSTWTAVTPEADHAFEVAYACPSGGGTGPCGLGAFSIAIEYPADFTFLSFELPPGNLLQSTGRPLAAPCSTSHDAVNRVATYACTTSGTTPGANNASGVLFKANFQASTSLGSYPLNLGNTVLSDISYVPIAHTSQSGTVSVEVLGTDDTDGDGCTDLQEEGDDITHGGQRNPHDPYDFYDVPVPAKCDVAEGCPAGAEVGANGPRNRLVNMSDVLAVLFYVFTTDGGGMNANMVDYDTVKGSCTINGVPDQEEGLCYDRSSASPLSGPPNGVVNMIDVLAVLQQAFVANCT